MLLLVPHALRHYPKQPFHLQYMILAIILAVVGAVSAWAINLLRLQVLYAASKQKGLGQGLRFRCWPVFAACGSAFQPPTVVF